MAELGAKQDHTVHIAEKGWFLLVRRSTGSGYSDSSGLSQILGCLRSSTETAHLFWVRNLQGSEFHLHCRDTLLNPTLHLIFK